MTQTEIIEGAGVIGAIVIAIVVTAFKNITVDLIAEFGILVIVWFNENNELIVVLCGILCIAIAIGMFLHFELEMRKGRK